MFSCNDAIDDLDRFSQAEREAQAYLMGNPPARPGVLVIGTSEGEAKINVKSVSTAGVRFNVEWHPSGKVK